MLQKGQRVESKVKLAICNPGDFGVVYHIYDGNVAGVIFEGGNHDGFNEEDAGLMLEPLDEFDEFAKNYEFTNVIQLSRDAKAGKFTFNHVKGKPGDGSEKGYLKNLGNIGDKAQQDNVQALLQEIAKENPDAILVGGKVGDKVVIASAGNMVEIRDIWKALILETPGVVVRAAFGDKKEG